MAGKPASKRFMMGMAAVSVLLGLGVVYWAWRDHTLANANVASRCSVLTSEVATSTSERSSSKWWAAVTIEHEVGGKTYRRVDKGPSLGLSSEVAKDLPKVGTTMGCYYVDGRPDLVTIFPGKPTSTGALLGFAGFCFLLPFLLHFINERQKRRAG